MEVRTYNSELQENRKPLSILTTRVNSVVDTIDQLSLRMEHMIDNQFKMLKKLIKSLIKSLKNQNTFQ